MEELPGSAFEKLQVFGRMGPERWETSHAPVDKYYKLLVRGDLKKLKALINQYYEDVNMTFEINKNELEWQVKSHAMFGLSGRRDCKVSFQMLTNPRCFPHTSPPQNPPLTQPNSVVQCISAAAPLKFLPHQVAMIPRAMPFWIITGFPVQF